MRTRIFDTLLNVTVGDHLQYPEKNLDRFLLIAAEFAQGVEWIQDHCEILKANAATRQYIVRPIWDERDPFEIVIAIKRSEIVGKIYYEVIDLLPQHLELLTSRPGYPQMDKAKQARLQELRRFANPGKRVRHDKTTHTWPEPAHHEQWTPDILGKPTPQPTTPFIVKEPRWPF